MPASIFNGAKVKALKKIFSLNGGAELHSGTTDPTSVAVDAPAGSLYQNETSGKLYRKDDAGSSTNWSEMAVTGGTVANQYSAVIASPAIAGLSTHTTIAAGIAASAAGGQILITAGTYVESVSVNKQLDIIGIGIASVISGTLTFTSASQNSSVRNLKVTGAVTFDASAIGNKFEGYVPSGWSDTASNFTDSNTVSNQNLFQAMEE